MKSTNTNITQAQLRRELKAFKKEMLLIMRDFAEHAVYKAGFKYIDDATMLTTEGKAIAKKFEKFIQSKQYQDRIKMYNRIQMNWYLERGSESLKERLGEISELGKKLRKE